MRKLLWLIVLLFVSITTFSQADVSVQVNSLLSGRPLSGVRVTILHDATFQVWQATTTEQGIAFFPQLPVLSNFRGIAARQITLQDDGDNTAVKKEQDVEEVFTFDLTSGMQATIWVSLPEPTSTVDLSLVTVTAPQSPVQLDAQTATVSAELTTQEIQALPVEGRDITRSLYRLPNVTQATGFYPEAPNVAINGANALYTNYLIDGMDNNERFLGGQKFAIPVGFARNIQVLTSNYGAQYGWSGNGIINITTPSGTNTFTGEAFSLTRPGPVIDGASPYAQRDLSGNLVKDGFQRYQGGFAIGGPVLRNKTFFYINAEHTTDLKDNRLVSPDLGINEVVRGTNQFSYLSARIDHRWNDHLRSYWRFHSGTTSIARQGGGLEGGVSFPSAGSVQDRNSMIAAWHNSYVKGRFAAQTNVQFSQFNWDYGEALNGPQSQVTLWNPEEQPIAVIGHPGFIFDELENTWQVQQKFSWHTDKHIIRAGGGLISSDYRLFGGGNVNGNYVVKLTQDQLAGLQQQNLGTGLSINDLPDSAAVVQYQVELQRNSYGARQNLWHIYLTDQWTASPRLTITTGLRWSYDNLSKGGSDQGDFNNLSPRVHANYRLSKRSVLRGGYSLVYDRIIYAIYSDALQQNNTSPDYLTQLQALIDAGLLPATTDLSQVTFDGNLPATFENVNLGEGPKPAEAAPNRAQVFTNERRILNPNGYDNPYTHQLMVGYQYQAKNDLLFYVDALYNRSFNLFRLRDINAPAPYPINPDNVVVRSQAAADASRPVPIYSDANGPYALVNGDTLRGVARNVMVTETAGDARYMALSFTINKTLNDHGLGYRLTYTLSRLENNTDDINFRAQDANDFDAEWGPSLNDRTHVINAMVFYQPHERWLLTAASLVQSGQPINRIPDATLFGTTDLNGDGRSFGDAYLGNSDRWPGTARNSDRLPWSVLFDLSIQYTQPIGTQELIVRADVFNLLNTENLSGYSNNATQSNQIQVGPSGSPLVRRNAGPPRQFQFGLQYRF